MIHETRWTVEKIASRLKLIEPLVYRSAWELPSFKYKLFPQGSPGLPLDEQETASWDTLHPYEYWGRWDSEFVLCSRFVLPEGFPAGDGLALFLPLGVAGDFGHPEALAYVDGGPFAACDRNHQELDLPSAWLDGQSHLLTLHGWTGLGGYVGAEPTQLFLRPCRLVQVDQPARNFIARVRVALGVAQNLENDNPARAWILNALDAAFKTLDTREPLGGDFYASLEAAHAALDTGLRQAGPAMDVHIFATGHAHIDVAWLWPLAQTRQKAARTFHTALHLLERYPQFHFTQSQPQLYEFVRQDHPELFAQIQQKVAEGRWEVLGGMWLEADCNLTGAELLARQFLLGRGYFEQYFGKGVETPVLWLPDAFGFCGSLPQLIRLAGLKYFFSIKLSWSQYNQMPYDFFLVAGPGWQPGVNSFFHHAFGRRGVEGQYLQRRDRARPGAGKLETLQAKGIAPQSADGLRLWRRRRRPNPRDDREFASLGRFSGCAADTLGQRGGFLPGPGRAGRPAPANLER